MTDRARPGSLRRPRRDSQPESRSGPKLGQNFLVDASAPGRIAEALGPLAGRTVLEIGPGKGALTGALAARAGRVIAVELDPALAAALPARLPGMGVEVLQQDILQLDIGALARRLQTRLPVAGNLPYYITSPILRHLCLHSAGMERAVLMAQREVAERIAAAPGGREYGLLSAMTQLCAEPEILFTLPPQAFSPPPRVHSTVFRLEMRPRFAEFAAAPEGLIVFLERAFAHKRKTLVNNLRAAGYGAEAAAEALRQCGLPAQIRAEAVPLEEMLALLRALQRECPPPKGPERITGAGAE